MHKEISLDRRCLAEKPCRSHRCCFAKGITGGPEPFIFSLEEAQQGRQGTSEDALQIPTSACPDVGPLTSPTKVHLTAKKYYKSYCCNIVPSSSVSLFFMAPHAKFQRI